MSEDEIIEMLKKRLSISVEASVYSDDLSSGIEVQVNLLIDGEPICYDTSTAS